jgi:protein-disulfide isomerase
VTSSRPRYPKGALLLGALVAAVPGAALGGTGFDARATYAAPVQGAPSTGPVDALVTVVEYSDFVCGFCRRAAATLAELERLYPGDLRVVYRHSLLDPENGTQAAEASAAAAAQGRFWAFHDRLFAAAARLDRGELERAARDVGLDMARFRGDLDQNRFRSAVRAQDSESSSFGISGTPAFFINGKPLHGARSLGAFLSVVEAERARALGMVARGVPRAEVYQRLVGAGLPRAGAIADGADELAEPEVDPAVTYPIGAGDPGHRLGADDALVTLVGFGDYRCGYCARILPFLAQLKQDYGADLRLVHRHLPLGNNPESRRLAEAAAAAAAQGKFWQMHLRLYSAEGPLDRAALDAIAAEIGLDVARFRDDLDSGRMAAVVSRDGAEGARFGVNSTPTFFVNGTPVQVATLEEFRALLERKRSEARELVKRGVPRADLYRAITTSGRKGTR